MSSPVRGVGWVSLILKDTKRVLSVESVKVAASI
jgi:hypothetical protein